VQNLLDENYKSIDASSKMIEALERQDSGIILLILGDRSEGRAKIHEADSVFLYYLNIAQNNITIEGEENYIGKIRTSYSEYKSIWIKPIVGTSKEGDIKWYYENHHQAFASVKQAVKELMMLNQKTMYETGSELKNRTNKAIMPGVVAVIAGIIFSLIFSYFIQYYVIKPISRMIKGVNDYNDFKKPFVVEIETKDEINELAQAIKTLFAKRSSDTKL
jgi:HAMP domain-containing protein